MRSLFPNRPRLHRLLSRAIAGLSMAIVLSAPVARAADDPFPGADVKARLESFDAARTKDIGQAVRALIEMGQSKSKDERDLDLLLQLGVRDHDRIVRLAALGSIRDIDPAKGLAFYTEKATAEELLPTVFAIEGIQHLGSKADVPKLLELAANGNTLIAAAALRALPRLATKKHIDAIMDVSLVHADFRMSSYGAWAVQDLLKKTEPAVKRYAKIANKKKDERAERATAMVALLGDQLAPPHKWGDTLTEVRKLLLEVPDSVEIKSRNAEQTKKLVDALTWMRENAPGIELMIRASATEIELVADPKVLVDLEQNRIIATTKQARLDERKLGWNLTLSGGAVFQNRIGNPGFGHRGWELGIFDSYDFAVVARLWDAGPGGLPRRRYVADRIDRRPWGGQ